MIGKEHCAGNVTIVSTDLVSSTRLNVAVGDSRFLELIREHDRVVCQRLLRFGGEPFAHTGDGVEAVFERTDDAVSFALGLQTELDVTNREHADAPLRVRIGLARGDVIDKEGCPFGQTVVRSVRVCSAAGAGQVLADEDVVAGTDRAIARFVAHGLVHLKGFGGASILFQALAPAGSSPECGLARRRDRHQCRSTAYAGLSPGAPGPAARRGTSTC